MRKVKRREQKESEFVVAYSVPCCDCSSCNGRSNAPSLFNGSLLLCRLGLHGRHILGKNQLGRPASLAANGFHKDLELLSTTMTVRLGSMLLVGFGAMIAVRG